MSEAISRPPAPSLRSRLLGLIPPLALIAAVTLLGWIIARNVSANLAAAGMEVDFSFLWQEAGFDVSQSLIGYSPRDSYARVLLVGALNTLIAAAVVLVLASLIGLVVGIAMTSSNWLVRTLAHFYVELLRNLPKLLILIALYVLMVRGLPHIRSAWTGPLGIQLSNRGLFLPWPTFDEGAGLLAATVMVWLAGGWIWARLARRRQELTGLRPPVLLPFVGAGAFGLWLLVMSGAVAIGWSTPVLRGFNVSGGMALSLQFTALVVALSVYHGGQIGAIVRGGIIATSTGQREAAYALGLNWFKTMRLIVLPQALRVITPPLGNQYSNLLKNTSIALAVGYSDLLSVVSTSINQTFRPIELMAIVALFFLVVNMLISAAVNWVSHSYRLKGR
jgi:general L-amino acid transport system permease protein